MTYEETKTALVDLLSTFGVEPHSLYDVGVPLVGRGFDQDTIVNALFDLANAGVIKLLSGDSVRVLRRVRSDCSDG